MKDLIIKFKSRSGVFQFQKNKKDYITINPGSEFRIYLKNEFEFPVDVEVGRNNKKIGTWRIAPESEIILTRPGSGKERFSMSSSEINYYFDIIKPPKDILTTRKLENILDTKNKISRQPEYAWSRKPYPKNDVETRNYRLITRNQKWVPRMPFTDPYLYRYEPEDKIEHEQPVYTFPTFAVTLTK